MSSLLSVATRTRSSAAPRRELVEQMLGVFGPENVPEPRSVYSRAQDLLGDLELVGGVKETG